MRLPDAGPLSGSNLPHAVYKDEGVVKDKSVLCSVSPTACSPELELRTKSSEHHASITCDGANRSIIHLCGRNLDHDVACEHPAAVPVRKWKTSFRFPRRASAVFCTGRSGCESAQSISRSSFRRPQHVAGCSRCERSPDRLCWCAASRTTARLTSLPPPPLPLPFSCDGSDAGIACEILHPGDTPSVRSRPAACAGRDSPVC